MKEKLKVYHGLPKSPDHEATVFYASFNGSMTPEVCGSLNVSNSNTYTFAPNVCGYGFYSNTHTQKASIISGLSKNLTHNVYTVDFWVDTSHVVLEDMPEVSNGREQYGAYIQNSMGTSDFRFFGYHKHKTTNAYTNLVRVYATDKNYDFYIPMREGLNHFRFIRDNSTLSMYVNGSLYNKSTFSFLVNMYEVSQIRINDLQSSFCDFRIVNADLGDCFPTLPQDFIDGKAIVVPALNQRQSYGDPVLHQVTNLLVPAQLESERGKYYSETDRDSDGYERCLASPELHVGNWHNWAETYGKIRITGLDKTYITGVIDTDTSKCIVTSTITSNTTTGSFTVDDTSKLTVGDRLWIYSSTMNDTWELNETNYLQITSINHATKEITATTNRSTGFKVTRGDILIETTASTSSPVVKTVDGTVVNGTWSGLGTYQATFTFGSNSNIAGKDLVVTYCLNAKGNASPYPKMPSEVIRGYDELGNELKPQNSVVIYDDYLNKKSGDKTNCPHKLYWQNSSSLTDFFGDEYNQEGYDCVKNNNKTLTYSPFPREYPMIIAEVDLFHLVESQLGETIPGNKANWLRDNILTIKCYAHCKGLYGSTPYVEIRYQDKGSNGWSLNSGNTCKHESSSLKTIYANIGSEQIPDDGIKRFCITTKNTFEDLVINEVEVQYIYFSVEFKPNTSNDSCLYVLFREETPFKLDNKRETKPCNPIIVNTQTKEVKRLVPSTKPFSTEVLMYNSGDITSAPNSNVIVSSNQHVLTTMGTGKLETNLRNQYRGLIGKLDLTDINSSDYLGEHSYKLPVNTGNNTNGLKFVLSQPFSENFNFFQIEEYFPDVRHLALKHAIVESNKELYLRLVCLDLESDILNKSVHQYYRLPNRPLIK